MMALHPIGQLHFAVGVVAILTGAAALTFRKGSTPHRGSGKIFFVSMLALGLSGLYFSYSRAVLFTWFLSILSLYLVATGWMTAKRQEGTIGTFEKLALAFILLSGLGAAGIGIAAMAGVQGLTDEVPGPTYLIWAGFAAWFGALDYRLIRRGGIAGKHRIARHLWRMLAAMLIAVAIFFLGNNDVLPDFLRTEFLLTAPIFLVIILMIFWLIRVLATKRYDNEPFQVGDMPKPTS